MSPAPTAVAVAVVSGVIVAIAAWAGRRFLEQAVVDHLKDFAWTFVPVWLGLLVAMMVWAGRSLWRITHGRDDEYTAWLRVRHNEINAWTASLSASILADYEVRFTKMAGEVRLLRDGNTEAIQNFNAALSRREAVVDTALLALSRRLTDVANHVPGYRGE